ncbi:MAG: redox-sensing transcriptional repressor Rex [Chloroflexi bacterium]|nr:redox-sensing transcriptional repressor Rex [Chloroflexota bacterium]MBU1751868.1 redox-sensing transcriptional repressor Rex [Chloroflexota bacterium]
MPSPLSNIPAIVVARLPLYLRSLNILAESGSTVISSAELGARLGITPAQIRKDLSFFGEFGKQGTGYDVLYLREQLKNILHLDQQWSVALVGAGDLGRAIAQHGGLGERGFRIVAIFDQSTEKIGEQIGDIPVESMDLLPIVVRRRQLQLAIIAVPANRAQRAADVLVASGIKGILSYAPIRLHVPDTVQVRYIDPLIALQEMTYYLGG